MTQQLQDGFGRRGHDWLGLEILGRCERAEVSLRNAGNALPQVVPRRPHPVGGRGRGPGCRFTVKRHTTTLARSPATGVILDG
ncbi:hypothetical protein GCM10009826_40930 [Humibacillus xanthopallidus]